MYSVGFIGTGPDPENPSRHGYAMAYRHAEGYRKLENCELTACADLVEERASKFAERYNIPPDRIYTSYERMLSEVEPDILSVCTHPDSHAEIVTGCAESGIPEAIHCEKPMDLTWGGSREMARACEGAGIQLTFNHQRRFGFPFREAKRLLEEGAIGPLRKVEFSVGDLYDYGSHSFDMCGYFNDEISAKWAMAQIDYREENLVFDAHNENQALAIWQYENGVYGLATTGPAADFLGCHNRILGEEGIIEIGVDEGPIMRIKRKGGEGWERIDTGGENCHGPNYIDRAIADVVRSLEEGEESELRAENALKATEVIFACWESVRRRARVDLPLSIEDNPLESMVAEGELNPRPRE